MFKEEVHVKKKNDLRYGTTKKPSYETLNEIMSLLEKHDCERIVTDRKGDELRIGFIFEGRPYKIQIPKVFVRGEYQDKIGIRVVYHFLRMVLSWTKDGLVSMDKALMSGRMVRIGNQSVALGEMADKVDDGDFSSMLENEADNLPEPEEDDIEEADYEMVK